MRVCKGSKLGLAMKSILHAKDLQSRMNLLRNIMVWYFAEKTGFPSQKVAMKLLGGGVANLRIGEITIQIKFRARSTDFSKATYYYEPCTTQFVYRYLSKINGTFIDVGAHIGRYTLIGAAILGNRGKVLAFEPNPDVLMVLQHNIRINGFTNVECYGVALGSKNGWAELHIPLEEGSSSLIPRKPPLPPN